VRTSHLQTKSHVPTAHLSPSSDEYVLDLLSVSEEKLLKLLEDLDGRELMDILRQMEEEEVSGGNLRVRKLRHFVLCRSGNKLA